MALLTGGADEHRPVRTQVLERDRVAEDGDELADRHDVAAGERDREADSRDALSQTRTTARTSLKDTFAAADRQHARQDRRRAAEDRTRAAADRRRALLDRSASASERITWSYDGLTGLYRRDTGMVELARDIARAGRSGTSYVLAYVDVDGLKARNDSGGHAAGDRLLVRVAETLRSSLRPYDLAVRIGGDEVVCGLPDMGFREARQRFDRIGQLLLSRDAAVTFGLAVLRSSDSLQSLIERAGAAMYDQRHIDIRSPEPDAGT